MMNTTNKELEWKVKILPFLYVPVVTIGVLGAIVMVLATVKQKTFKSPCHRLILILCVTDAIHNMGQLPTIITILTNQWVTQRICFYSEALFLPGNFASLPLALIIGVDRLISINSPIMYYSLRPQRIQYLLKLLILPIACVAVGLVSSYTLTTDKPVFPCSVPQAKGQIVFRIFNVIHLIMCFFIICSYICLWLSARKQMDTSTNRLLLPTITVVAMLVVGWMPASAISLVAPLLEPSKSISNLQLCAGVFVNIACSLNVFVYYFTSLDYRQAIKQLFKRWTNAQKTVSVLPIHLEEAII